METQPFDPFDVASLYTKHAEAEAVKEANAYRTLPTASYRLTTRKVEYRVCPESGPWPGAELVHLQVDALQRDAEVPRKGVLFFDISYQTLRNREGRLESPTRLWGNYEKALGVIGKNAGEVLEAVTLYPVDAYVTESFKTLAGYRTPKTPQDREELVQAGYEARNFVQNVRAAK